MQSEIFIIVEQGEKMSQTAHDDDYDDDDDGDVKKCMAGV